ncbi:hypothetical protein SAMN05421544_10252 [Riemerella columbipharyngis]|uniref:Uncharacterized protein n=1 Tax=Riemerella columbipharyngis TaxID=1071918 RepID=A0A1G6ZEY0_9FLAO|nr:hypothetical protein SAMN05421544_10252 [Riemerella columbipharyngis]
MILFFFQLIDKQILNVSMNLNDIKVTIPYSPHFFVDNRF